VALYQINNRKSRLQSTKIMLTSRQLSRN